jgi:cystathionine beta-lyase/cystathionine gamma-synthase
MQSTKTGSPSRFGFSTRAVWSGQDPCPATGATVVPIYQTATFTFDAIAAERGFDYARDANPTRLALEQQLADLEGARFGLAFGSGIAAIMSVASLLSRGDHIIAGSHICAGTHRLFSTVLPRYGITTSFVEMTDPEIIRRAMQLTTRMMWIETPSNPTLRITDVARIVGLKRPDQIVAVDNTLASPFCQQPIAGGCDVVVNSTSKYINGHSDVIGGVIATNDPDIYELIAQFRSTSGAIPGAWDSFLTLRGAKTLALRMFAHERNAQSVAEFLNNHAEVAEVHYPGLRTHPQHELARRQMRSFGGVVSFRPRGGAARAHKIARSTRVFSLAPSFGGVESLICHPATMTHGSFTPEERASLGITPDLLRLSVGIEGLDDLIADLESVLDRPNGGGAPAASR